MASPLWEFQEGTGVRDVDRCRQICTYRYKLETSWKWLFSFKKKSSQRPGKSMRTQLLAHYNGIYETLKTRKRMNTCLDFAKAFDM